MFEQLAQGGDLAHVDDAVLVDAITGWTRAEATVASHRMAAIAELTERRCAAETARQRQYWACDGWDSAAAEVAAASGIGQRKASGQMHQALALRHRLPQIAKLMAEGTLAARLVSAISWRTQLIEDPDVLARVDADLAAIAARFGPMSTEKFETAVDAAITVHDPAAVRRFQTAAAGCDLKFGDRNDETGTTTMWGRVTVTDGELFERRVEQLVGGVCPHDPRTLGDRRSAAIGVIGAGGTQLPCTCERPDCPAAGPDARAEAIVIHVLTDHHPDTGPDADPPSGPGPDAGPPPDADPVGPEHGTAAEPTPDPEPPAPAAPAATPSRPESRGGASGLAVIAGGGIVPTPLLTELVKLGAPVRSVPSACELGAEPRYRPSAKLVRFVRSRDLTCCFPNCERPAEYCDIDHTTPHGIGGLTHPGNTKCLCRKHHLLKTFWTGVTGWADQQLRDGTIVWISPTGHRYTRPPGSRLYFPRWDTTTPLPASTPTPPATTGAADRGLTMPTRKQTRAQQTAQRLRAERQRNQQAIDAEPSPI